MTFLILTAVNPQAGDDATVAVNFDHVTRIDPVGDGAALTIAGQDGELIVNEGFATLAELVGARR